MFDNFFGSIKNLNKILAVLTSLTSLICAFLLLCQNMYLFVCVIGWKPEMIANGLRQSHISNFMWKITSTQILQFYGD